MVSVDTVASVVVGHVSMFELYICKDLVAKAYQVHMLGLPLVPE